MYISKNSNISKLNPHQFSFERWRAGSLAEFGIQTRTYSIELNRQTIRKYAVGFIEGHKLWIRPKLNTIAIMFWFKDDYFWTHLTIEEFIICFPELEDYVKTIMN